ILVLQENDSIEAAHHVPLWVKLSPLVVGLIGIAVAYWFYMFRPEMPARVASAFRPLYNLSFRKWYFDELYDLLFVRPAFWIGRGLWKSGDGAIIDGFVPDGVASATRDIARRASRL